MFGLIGGCGGALDREDRRAWAASVCGLCQSLGRRHGLSSRLATNTDAAFLAALGDAQAREEPAGRPQRCPLRRFRHLFLPDPQRPVGRFAAAMALLMGAVKVRDHAEDGQGVAGRLTGPARWWADRWTALAAREAAALGFDPAVILDARDEQARREREPGRPPSYYAEPTARAAGSVFAHLATLVDRPENAAPLYELGRRYGRLVYLVDGWRDRASDEARSRFNPWRDRPDARGEMAAIVGEALDGIRTAFARLRLARPRLAEHLCFEAIPAVCHASTNSTEEEKKRRERTSWCDWCDCCGCCECCDSCDCC